jgi:hypothetical protein
MSLFAWLWKNKVPGLLIIVIVFLILKPSSPIGFNSRSDSYGLSAPQSAGGVMMKSIAPMATDSIGTFQEAAPQANVVNRMVIQNSNLSLLVKNVIETRDNIVNFAQANGGYMVSSEISNPQDAPSATVIVRVNAEKLKAAIAYLHSLSVKVVSENLEGYDVTDQYVDIDKRIAILQTTINKFQSILDQAKEVSDIMNINQQIINIQSQIDSYKGQQMALKQNADLAKLTVYISTDEIALPYAPNDTFRPAVIFKLAVRSLVADLRKVAEDSIWIGVYAVIWIPILVICYFVWRFANSKGWLKTSVKK